VPCLPFGVKKTHDFSFFTPASTNITTTTIIINDRHRSIAAKKILNINQNRKEKAHLNYAEEFKSNLKFLRKSKQNKTNSAIL